jgi:hypothetical protein
MRILSLLFVVLSTTAFTECPQGANYGGFGYKVTNGAGFPMCTVTNSNDTGTGSLRDCLATAQKNGGGHIVFDPSVARYDIYPKLPPLAVPPHSYLDAADQQVTLWGDGAAVIDTSRGILNIYASDVAVNNIAVRNSPNDGIHLAPQAGSDIHDIALDHISATGNADGGIDITGTVFGSTGNILSDIVVQRSFVAGSGRYCQKKTCTGLCPCGGGTLFKYGATNGSFYANYYFANLERCPLISSVGYPAGTVADIRYSICAYTAHDAMSVRENASANIIGNFFVGGDDAKIWPPAFVYYGGGNHDGDTPASQYLLTTQIPVNDPGIALPESVALNAGVVVNGQRSAVDACYLALPNPTFDSLKASTCDAL